MADRYRALARAQRDEVLQRRVIGEHGNIGRTNDRIRHTVEDSAQCMRASAAF